jgi:hypothetical protein
VGTQQHGGDVMTYLEKYHPGLYMEIMWLVELL